MTSLSVTEERQFEAWTTVSPVRPLWGFVLKVNYRYTTFPSIARKRAHTDRQTDRQTFKIIETRIRRVSINPAT